MKIEINKLLQSADPSIQYRVQVDILGKDKKSPELHDLQQEIKYSPLVRQLLSERDVDGKLPHHAYSKWDGAHWVMAALADLSYPPGDETLIPLREQQLGWLFSERHQNNFNKRTVDGRVRMHPSQEGNAVYSLIKLGLVDNRIEKLVQRMLDWQWPDGGWNCDMNPEVKISSFMESLLPMRALVYYENMSGDPKAKEAYQRTAEIFLKRSMYKRQRDGEIMNHNFVALHYPCYWHYDILFGLKVMAEAGLILDERCSDALDLLESKQLPDGGFPAGKKYYQVTDKRVSGRSLVDWGGTSKKHMNEWVTVDAIYVLKEAGRVQLYTGEG
ncbi:MAG: hypothetical protein E3J88_01085 [Anaerolineales bacterium]|nr:MAG: hypothetical protein E3J88_01085 [Anaerolineales bacterium]